jgi:uncharacterized membrane protein YraQ (UPF0718 family)
MFEILYAYIQPGFAALETYVMQKIAGAFIPSFFIAGAIHVFIPKHMILSNLSAQVSKLRSHSVALVAGGALSVCACGILPLFQTIYKRGAGLGPSMTFLFAGPAINIIAIFYTFQFLGLSMVVARIVGVMILSVICGLLASYLFEKPKDPTPVKQPKYKMRMGGLASPWALAGIFISLIAMVLVLPLKLEWSAKIIVCAVSLFILIPSSLKIERDIRKDWLLKSCSLMGSIIPKLLGGIFVIGLLEGLTRSFAVQYLTGEISLFLSCLIASMVGAFLYLGTILGIVVVHGLVQLGMTQGPALSFLLAGPTIALPSMLVIFGVCPKKPAIYFILFVILGSALAGWGYEAFFI